MAMVHVIVNASGIVLFYIIPFARLPLFAAKLWGSKVLQYNWFFALYLITSFILLPVIIYGLSLINTVLLYIVVSVTCAVGISAVTLNHLQIHHKSRLPVGLRTWDFLPAPLHSLSLIDYVVQTYMEVFCCCLVRRTVRLSQGADTKVNWIRILHGRLFSSVTC